MIVVVVVGSVVVVGEVVISCNNDILESRLGQVITLILQSVPTVSAAPLSDLPCVTSFFVKSLSFSLTLSFSLCHCE